MMTEQEIKDNIFTVRSRISAAAERRAQITGVMPSVTLVAATKTVPADVIAIAVKNGITDIGENRAQEYVAKKELVQGAKWHFIGTLQRNKAKYLVGGVSLIQSVSSAELAREIDRLSAARGITTDVLAEVNIGGEKSKTGAAEGDIDGVVKAIVGCKSLRLRGIMSVLPIGADGALYERTRQIYARYAGGEVDTLSMGMSGDFETAIEHGATMVRIGSGIFGQRNN